MLVKVIEVIVDHQLRKYLAIPGKVDLSLIPIHTLEDEARVWMYGEKKYKRFISNASIILIRAYC